MKGFMRFQKETTVKFKDGITVIYGNNGSGKTSIIDAIFFCLYGKTIRTSGTLASGFLSLKDLINKDSNEAEVAVEFSIDGLDYSVNRKITSSGKTLSYIKLGNEQIAEGKHVSELLENSIIGLGFDELKDSIIIMQDEMSKYIEMKPIDRKNALIDLFKINEYEKYKIELNDKAKELNGKIEESKMFISNLKNSIESENNILNQLNAYNSTTRASSVIVNEETENLEKIEKDLTNVESDIEKVGLEIKLAEQSKRKNEETIKSLKNGMSSIEGKTTCPLCFQNIENSMTVTDHYNSEIKKLEDQIIILNTDISTATKKYNELSILEKELNYKKQKIKTTLENETRKAQEIKTNIEILNSKLEEISKTKKQLTEEKAKIEKYEKKYGNYQVLKEAYDTIPKKIVARIVPALEKEASKLISIISENYISEIKVDRDTFKIMPYVNGEFEEIHFLSSGERVMVAVALRVGLSNIISKLSVLASAKNLKGIKTLVIDEGDFGSLDTIGLNNIISILNNLKPIFPKIILITHIDMLKDSLSENIINVVKTEKYESKITDNNNNF